MNLFTKHKQTHRHRKQTYGYQKGKEGRDKLGVWDYRYTLLYIKQINNKDFLYSTGNYINYIVRTYFENKIYITESLCCTPETNTIL